jgi:bacterioferritin-associated ferredoxin
MIVCVCNALSESACREAACHPECRGAGCIYRLLGARVRCGRCVPFVQALVHAVKESEGACGAPALISGGPPAVPASGR